MSHLTIIPPRSSSTSPGPVSSPDSSPSPSPRGVDYDHPLDLDVGARLGFASVTFTSSAQVCTLLKNTLALSDTDTTSLCHFCSLHHTRAIHTITHIHQHCQTKQLKIKHHHEGERIKGKHFATMVHDARKEEKEDKLSLHVPTSAIADAVQSYPHSHSHHHHHHHHHSTIVDPTKPVDTLSNEDHIWIPTLRTRDHTQDHYKHRVQTSINRRRILVLWLTIGATETPLEFMHHLYTLFRDALAKSHKQQPVLSFAVLLDQPKLTWNTVEAALKWFTSLSLSVQVMLVMDDPRWDQKTNKEMEHRIVSLLYQLPSYFRCFVVDDRFAIHTQTNVTNLSLPDAVQAMSKQRIISSSPSPSSISPRSPRSPLSDSSDSDHDIPPITIRIDGIMDEAKSLVDADGKSAKRTGADHILPSHTITPALSIIHFNDVYHIQATRTHGVVGGADRFMTCVKQLSYDDPIMLFSGDAFSPSTLSSTTKGSHMIPVLNALGVDVAMFGNHDFDFGVDVARELADRSNFPWLLSNVVDGETKKPLAHALITKLVTWHGLQVGLFGVCEQEWIDTLPRPPPGGIIYADFLSESKRLTAELRSQGAQLIIALTHSRLPNDITLAMEVPEIDLILGGHDHMYTVQVPESSGVAVIKSGSDFRNLSRIEVFLKDPGSDKNALKLNRVWITTQRVDVTEDVVPDPDMVKLVTSLAGEIDLSLMKPIGRVETELDATFQTARSQESNVGNWMCDIMRATYNTDMALIVGGTIRADDVYPPGDITMQIINDIFPFEDPTVILKVTGQQMWDALENGVCSMPKLDGRFPQVSGCRFVYDPSKPPLHRLISLYLTPAPGTETPIDLNATYTLVTREYLSRGKDGFDTLAKAQVIQDAEHGHLLSTLLRNYFWSIEVMHRLQSKQGSSARLIKTFRTLKLHHINTPHHSFQPEKPLIVAPKVEGRILTVDEAKSKGVKI